MVFEDIFRKCKVVAEPDTNEVLLLQEGLRLVPQPKLGKGSSGHGFQLTIKALG